MSFRERLFGGPRFMRELSKGPEKDEVVAVFNLIKNLNKETAKAAVVDRTITAGAINKSLEVLDLNEEQRDVLITIAENPSLAESFPRHVVNDDQAIEVGSLTTVEEMETNLPPLDQREMEIARDSLVESMASGKIPVFVAAHVWDIPKTRMTDPQMLSFSSMSNNPEKGEGQIYLDKLVPGYKNFLERFGPDALRTLFGRALFIYADRGHLSFDEDASEKELHQLGKRRDEARFSTRAIDTFVNKGFQFSGVRSDREKKRVYSVYETRSSTPMRCIQVILASNDRIGGDPRKSNMVFTIFLEDSNSANRSMHISPGNQPHDSYSYITRGLARNPGLVLEALRKFIPEVFEGSPGKWYYKAGDQNLKMSLNIPEWQKGVYDFQQME